jgi:hypothetical protein
VELYLQFPIAFLEYRRTGLLTFLIRGTVKDKAIPLQAWTGPKGSRKLKLPNFKIIGT